MPEGRVGQPVIPASDDTGLKSPHSSVPFGALHEIVVPFSVDDSDILTGKHIYTPMAGERLLSDSAISITEEFDGTTPTLALISEGGDVADAPMTIVPPLTVDIPFGSGSTLNRTKTELDNAAYFVNST